MYTKHQWLVALCTSLPMFRWLSIISSLAQCYCKTSNSRFHFSSAQGAIACTKYKIGWWQWYRYVANRASIHFLFYVEECLPRKIHSLDTTISSPCYLWRGHYAWSPILVVQGGTWVVALKVVNNKDQASMGGCTRGHHCKQLWKIDCLDRCIRPLVTGVSFLAQGF